MVGLNMNETIVGNLRQVDSREQTRQLIETEGIACCHYRGRKGIQELHVVGSRRQVPTNKLKLVMRDRPGMETRIQRTQLGTCEV